MKSKDLVSFHRLFLVQIITKCMEHGEFKIPTSLHGTGVGSEQLYFFGMVKAQWTPLINHHIIPLIKIDCKDNSKHPNAAMKFLPIAIAIVSSFASVAAGVKDGDGVGCFKSWGGVRSLENVHLDRSPGPRQKKLCIFC